MTSSPSRVLHALVLTCVAIGAVSCTAKRVKIGDVEGSHALAAGTKGLAVMLERGSVRFERGAAGGLTIQAEVLVRETRVAEFPTPLEFDEHVRVSVVEGVVEIQSAHQGHVDEDDWQLDIVVAVPDGLALRAKVDAGTVTSRVDRITGFEAVVDAGTVDVVTHRIEGPSVIRIDAGKLEFEVIETVGDLRFDIDAGRARIRLPAGAEYGLDLAVTAGDVDVASRITTAEPKRNYAEATLRVAGPGPQVVGRIDAGQIVLE